MDAEKPGRARLLDQRVKLHHLRAVEAIAAQGSLLRASALLGISQPALTRTLRELEQIVGETVFDRDSRGARLTAQGHVVLRTAQRMMAELRRLSDELDEQAGPEGGRVSVGALPVAATGVLPGTLIRLKAAHPRLQVSVQQGRSEELLPLLSAGTIDLIVGRLYVPAVPDGHRREVLWDEPISIVARAGHPVFALPRITLQDLQGYELVLPTVSQRVGQEIEFVMGVLGLRPSASLRSSSYGFIREMLHATELISVMPQMMMGGDLLRGTLRVVPLPVAAPTRPAGLILPADRRLPPAGRLFIEALRAHVADMAARYNQDV